MIKRIGREEVLDMIEKPDPNVKVVDVLPEDYYAKEHIKGAISLPVGKIHKYADERLNKSDHIVVYCASLECQASPKAAALLQDKGFENIYDYEGGLEDWKRAGLPLEGNAVHV